MKARGLQLAHGVLPLVGLVLLAPTLAGLWQTLRTAFGLLPVLGKTTPSLEPWQQLLALPGFWTSVRLTLTTGFAATLLSLLLASGFAAWLWVRLGGRSSGRWLVPILATPHAALAIGLAFLLAPSGWLARLLASHVTGWEIPPAWVTVNDPWGGALILGLVLKETAFLTLVMLTALAQRPVARDLAAARALGWGPIPAWALIIWPQIYPMIRLPVLVVLAYSLSVVDVALILGPGTPPTLAVVMLRWSMAPDPALLLPASAAALALGLLLLVSVLLWWGGEWWVRRLFQRTLDFGPRLPGPGARWVVHSVAATGVVLGLLCLGAIVVLILWSVAFRWGFPAGLPTRYTALGWSGQAGWEAAQQTLRIGLASTAVALTLALLWLEAEDRRAQGPFALEKWLYLPLLIPAVSFLFGLHVVSLQLGLSGAWVTVAWSHVIFVFPYVMIVLAGSWRQLNPAWLRAAAALGAGPWRRFLYVKLPILLRPILVAAAVGFSVSTAQYLPTVFLGEGRITTLTTEAVALASGADRRSTAVHALLQMVLPLVGFALAAGIPALLHHHRRGLRGEGRP